MEEGGMRQEKKEARQRGRRRLDEASLKKDIS